MARGKRRSEAQEFQLFGANAPETGWRMIKRISLEAGERDVQRGAAVRVYDTFGRHVGYMLAMRTDQELPSGASSAALTPSDACAVAGLMGRSRTAHLSDDERMTRRSITGRLLPAEDFIERAIEKVSAYEKPANHHGDRAVRVYPKVAVVAKHSPSAVCYI